MGSFCMAVAGNTLLARRHHFWTRRQRAWSSAAVLTSASYRGFGNVNYIISIGGVSRGSWSHVVVFFETTDAVRPSYSVEMQREVRIIFISHRLVPRHAEWITLKIMNPVADVSPVRVHKCHLLVSRPLSKLRCHSSSRHGAECYSFM